MQMALSSFLLPPPSPPLPSPAAAAASASTSSSSYLVAAHRGRRPREPRCRCGRSPEITPATATSSGSGDRGSCEEEDASASPRLPVELDGAAASSADSQTGSATPRYQATSTKGDTMNGDFAKWENNQRGTDGLYSSKSKSGYTKAFGVDLSPDNVAVATVYFVQGVLGLSRLAVSFYLKDDLQLDPAELGKSTA